MRPSEKQQTAILPVMVKPVWARQHATYVQIE
jgi:hypothetical protein